MGQIWLVNEYVVAGESAWLGPRVNIGSLLSAELDAEIGWALARGC